MCWMSKIKQLLKMNKRKLRLIHSWYNSSFLSCFCSSRLKSQSVSAGYVKLPLAAISLIWMYCIFPSSLEGQRYKQIKFRVWRM